MTDTNPNPDIDLQQISTRNTYARNVVAGFAAAWPKLADWWQAISDALADIDTLAGLADEASRLSDELGRARLDAANLRAAMRATLAAHADGEADPLWYLRDELDAAGSAADASREAR